MCDTDVGQSETFGASTDHDSILRVLNARGHGRTVTAFGGTPREQAPKSESGDCECVSSGRQGPRRLLWPRRCAVDCAPVPRWLRQCSQALRLAVVRTRDELGGINSTEWRNARVASFQTTILALNTEVGQVVSITHGDVPGGAGNFRHWPTASSIVSCTTLTALRCGATRCARIAGNRMNRPHIVNSSSRQLQV